MPSGDTEREKTILGKLHAGAALRGVFGLDGRGMEFRSGQSESSATFSNGQRRRWTKSDGMLRS